MIYKSISLGDGSSQHLQQNGDYVQRNQKIWVFLELTLPDGS